MSCTLNKHPLPVGWTLVRDKHARAWVATAPDKKKAWLDCGALRAREWVWACQQWRDAGRPEEKNTLDKWRGK